MAPNDARLSAPLLLSDSDHNNHGDSSLDSIEDGRKAEKAPTLIYTKDGSVDVHGNASVKDKTGSWKACPFILGSECCERLVYYGISTNLVTYLTKELHEGNATAASNVSNWAGTCYITPLIGAFLADAYWGRYKTIGVFCSTYFVGMALLTIVAAIPWLKPPPCANEAISCSPASTYQLAVFYLALYLIALGTGGIKPCVSSFGADQFDDNDSDERKKKGSFFNWFYFTINIGALISSSVLVYIQDNIGWAWGFGIPTVTMGLAICSFLLGTPLYRHQKPGGSPLVRIVQVCVSSLRKWHVAVPSDPCLLYETESSAIQGSRKIGHTDEFLFLDKAAVETDVTRVSFHHSDPWRLCTVTQVEEVKILIRILPIWATGIMFATVYSQMSTLFVEQGRTMDTSMGPHFNIPPASLSLFDTLSVILWVPLYDRLVVPIARHFTKEVRGFTHLQRMGIGLFVSALSMIAAAIVEIRRLQIAREHDLLYDTSIQVPMSIFWQVPQYFLVGAAEIFTFIGQLEFFYDESPDAMRSLCSALSLMTTALGNYLSSFLVTIVSRVTVRGGSPGWIPDNLNIGHIDYFFWLLTVFSLLNLAVYLACARRYKYKKVYSLF